MGKVLKKQGNPVGIAISHCADANTSSGRCSGRTEARRWRRMADTAIDSDKTAQVIEWYKELYRDAMESEVLLGTTPPTIGSSSPARAPGSTTRSAPTMPPSRRRCRSPTTSTTKRASPVRPASTGAAHQPISIWKFSKNVDLAKDFLRFHFQKENYDAWIVASNAFNHPPLRHLADHPIWARIPSSPCCPRRRELAHPRGWPAKPNDAAQRIDVNYVMPDMVAKAVNGMPTRRAMGWAQDQVAQATKGQLKASG